MPGRKTRTSTSRTCLLVALNLLVCVIITYGVVKVCDVIPYRVVVICYQAATIYILAFLPNIFDWTSFMVKGKGEHILYVKSSAISLTSLFPIQV